MSNGQEFADWYEGMIRTIDDAESDEELSFFHDHRTACKAAWDARSDLIPKMPEDVAHIARCIICNRPVDTREASHGGDSHGCEMDDGSWVCSSECWTEAVNEELLDRVNFQAARIAELEEIVLAAEELAARFEVALGELEQYTVLVLGESYNCTRHNAALTAYRKAVEGETPQSQEDVRTTPTDQQQQEVRDLEAERQVLERKLQRLPEALRAYLMGKFSMRNE